VDYIEVKAPQCTKVHTHPGDTGIIKGQYIVVMKRNSTKTDLEVLIARIKEHCSNPNSLMKADNIQPAMELKMFNAELNDRALQWVCYNFIAKITY